MGIIITFYLWEEGSAEKDKYKFPTTAKVDRNGIAKVDFILSKYASQSTWMSFFQNHEASKKFFVTAVYEKNKVQNKGAVVVSDEKKAPTPSTNKPAGVAGEAISKMTEIIAEGLEKIGEMMQDDTQTATSIGAKPVDKKTNNKCPRCENDITSEQIKAICVSKKNNKGVETCLIQNDKFIIRYGEVENDTVVVKVGDDVKQKDLIGKTGWLRTWYKGVVSGYEIYMLHFEYYSGDAGFDVSSSLSNSSSPFRRRSDLKDGVEILQEGYRNTFEEDAGDRVPPSTLSTSEQGQEFIKDYEKFESKVYNDSEGYCTIGYGYLIAKSRCEDITIPQRFQNGITQETALELFHEKLRTFESAVRRDILVNLYQHEFDALVSLLYNTGANFLNVGGRNDGETQIKIKINNGDYPGGADQFSDVTNGGVTGLVTRRTQEMNMFKNNIYDSTH